MNKVRKTLVVSGVIACIIACTGDFFFTFLYGSRYPGYSQISDTMSSLGASVSPVSDEISFWWVILGILIIIFALGFRIALSPADRFVKISFWMMILYGMGEGMGSGLFKADLIDNSQGSSFIIHDILGGTGVAAILILPLFVRKILPFSSSRTFVRYSRVVFISGLFCLILFSFRFISDSFSSLARYKGLWQRLFVLDYYLYMLVIAFIMAKNKMHYYR